MSNKRIYASRIVLIFMTLLLCLCVYCFSAKTSKESNSDSSDVTETILNNGLKVLNYSGITHAYPNEDKLEHAVELLNPPVRKLAHASIYFLLATLLLVTLSSFFGVRRAWFCILCSLLLSMVLASLDEYHQTGVNGRTGQALDILIDTLGALLAVVLYITYSLVFVVGYRQGLKEKTNENRRQKSKQ